MKFVSWSNVIAESWERVMADTPADFLYDDVDWALGARLLETFGQKRLTYRERLDRVRRNYLGEPMSRIAIVRWNLRQFKAGNTMRWRGPDVKDRREYERRSSRGRRRSD